MRAAGLLPISPNSCMPLVNAELPATLLTMTMVANTRVLARRTSESRTCSVASLISLIAGIRRSGCLLPLFRNEFLATGAEGQVFPGFLGKPLPLVRVEHGLFHDPPDNARAEIIFPVELLDPVHQFR